MSEERLRDLLARAVPEAPEVRADGVPERAATLRRRQAVAGGAALVLVVAAVFGGIALGGDTDRDGDAQVANDVPTTPSGSTAPYDVPLCPAQLPELTDANTRMPKLDDVVAVRSCPDLLGWDSRRAEIEPDEREGLADLDALVDVELFGEAIADVPAYDPERCAAIDVVNGRQSLMFVRSNGTSELVATPLCWAIDIGPRDVDGGTLGLAFGTALDQQRDQLAYTHPFEGSPCADGGGVGHQGPAKPGREQLVAACYAGDGDSIDLDDAQMAALRAAWADPRPVTEQLNEHTENECTEGGDGTAIYAGTDRSDVVRMIWSPCGYLVWDSWEPGGNAAIPITLEELGLR